MTAPPTGGPPEKEEPAPTPGSRPIHNHIDAPDSTGKELVWVPCTRPPAPQDIASQLRRRRTAAHRSVPLACGHRDPWPDCRPSPLTDCQLDGWRDAARHVLAAGQTPLMPLEARRGLWKRGGADRELVEQLHQAWQVVA